MYLSIDLILLERKFNSDSLVFFNSHGRPYRYRQQVKGLVAMLPSLLLVIYESVSNLP